jgi:hypothetical protein
MTIVVVIAAAMTIVVVIAAAMTIVVVIAIAPAVVLALLAGRRALFGPVLAPATLAALLGLAERAV